MRRMILPLIAERRAGRAAGAFSGLHYTPEQPSTLPAGAGNSSGAGSGIEQRG